MSAPAPSTGLTAIDGPAVPFDYASVDTDAMFPVSSEDDAARYGYGAALFGRWRVDPDFILNRPEHAGATILVAGPQFGIGSSRETAVWALKGAGFQAVLAPSFGEIFRTNCVRNGVLTAVVDQPGVDRLQAWLIDHPGGELHIDLLTNTVAGLDGAVREPITVNGFARRCLVEGLDEFALLASYRDRIDHRLASTGAWAPDTSRSAAAIPEGSA